ncbi:MAG: polysialyltransferase family glycosyltransferase [Pseudomonadota bacterium]|nr:polysialyltransferase family glycosyltransferase [Pseudomonadota bacterium]
MNNLSFFKIASKSGAKKNIFFVNSVNNLKKSKLLSIDLNIENSFYIFLVNTDNKTQAMDCINGNDKNTTFLSLTKKPNRVRFWKYIYLFSLYLLTLRIIKPQNIYLFHNYGHYALIKLACSKKTKINLIEDGLFNYSNHHFERRNLTKKGPISKLWGFKEVFTGIDSFNNYYCSYPEVAKKYINANNYIKINSSLIIQDIPPFTVKDTKIRITENDILFINQNYSTIPTKEHFKAVITILSSFRKNINQNIYIKLHPNDNLEEVKKILKSYNMIYIIDRYIKAEAIIHERSPKTIISLNSTTLIYTHLFKRNLILISISPAYIKHFKKFNYDTTQIIKDMNTIKQFEFIKLI